MVTFRDVRGYQGIGEASERAPVRSDRLFMNERARYIGDAIAAVAADDEYTAQRALELVQVSYDVHEPFPDAERNLSDEVRAIHDGTVAGFAGPQPAGMPTVEYKRGNLENGFGEADMIVEGRYVTPIQCHAPIEPHAVVAAWEGDTVTFWDSQQSVFAAQEMLASALGVERRNVRVISNHVGGGFGGKCTDTLARRSTRVLPRFSRARPAGLSAWSTRSRNCCSPKTRGTRSCSSCAPASRRTGR
jgi:CO/xanthine dehydrogenase Mo-binding subunit